MELSKEQIRDIIAKRVALEFAEGDVITLGIGLPTEVANHIPHDVHVIFQSENGLIGVGQKATEDNIDKCITNAGGVCVTAKSGACFFDSLTAFTMIRGGHIDATVLGALEVDEEGNVANWLVPGVFAPGMGGAMDLVVGAKKVIVAMEHLAKGKPKILKRCTLPLTGQAQVDLIVTERCVIEVTPKGLLLTELNPLFSLEEVLNTVEANLIISDNLKKIAI